MIDKKIQNYKCICIEDEQHGIELDDFIEMVEYIREDEYDEDFMDDIEDEDEESDEDIDEDIIYNYCPLTIKGIVKEYFNYGYFRLLCFKDEEDISEIIDILDENDVFYTILDGKELQHIKNQKKKPGTIIFSRTMIEYDEKGEILYVI